MLVTMLNVVRVIRFQRREDSQSLVRGIQRRLFDRRLPSAKLDPNAQSLPELRFDIDRASVPNCGVWNCFRGFKLGLEGLRTAFLSAALSRSFINLLTSLSLLILHCLSPLGVVGKRRIVVRRNLIM